MTMMMMHEQQSSEDERSLKRSLDDMSSESLSSSAEDILPSKPHKKSKHCRASKAKWTPEEDDILTRAVLMSGEGNWKKIAQSLHDRSHLQCLHRWQKVLNPALVKGPWKEEEDTKLSELVEKYGPKDWSTIAGHIPGRIGKQCRERWFNHLSPDVRKTNWTPEEDSIIIDAHSKYGNKWTNISKLLDGRPANAIKNHWNSTLLKRIQDMNGEPTVRRDRNRSKRASPSSMGNMMMRATEYDFRTQGLLHNSGNFSQQHFEESSDSSPHNHYMHALSPVSSPENYHHQHEGSSGGFAPHPNMLSTVRYQIPDAPHVFFANPFNAHYTTSDPHHPTHHQTHAPLPTATQQVPTWDTWPAPNIIHLTHPTPTAPTHMGLNHQYSHAGTHYAMAPHATHMNTMNTMNVYDADYGMLSSSGGISSGSEASSPQQQQAVGTGDAYSVMSADLYIPTTPSTPIGATSSGGAAVGASGQHHGVTSSQPSSAQGSPLPTELQYCFDSQHGLHGGYDGDNSTHGGLLSNIGTHPSDLSRLLGLESLPALYGSNLEL